MVVGAAAAGGTDAMDVVTAVAIAFDIAAVSVVRLVGYISLVLFFLTALLACGDASPDTLTFDDPFPFAMLG